MTCLCYESVSRKQGNTDINRVVKYLPLTDSLDFKEDLAEFAFSVAVTINNGHVLIAAARYLTGIIRVRACSGAGNVH